MPKLYTFKVSGTGRFPLDMLRYDSCWPSLQADVANLDYNPADLVEMANGQKRYRKREVTLLSHTPPTKDRWASFMWYVTEEKKR